MAPLYDAVTTRVFPRLETDRLALELNGKDDRLSRADFRAFAKTAGLKSAAADAAIDGMLGRLADAIDRISLPHALDCGDTGDRLAERLLTICRSRTESFS